MKSIRQVAKECGLYTDVVRKIAKEIGLTNHKFFTNIQAEYLQQKLHEKGYFTELTLESKMN